MTSSTDNSRMERNTLMIDTSRCIGCQACAVACKLEHGLPPGPFPVRSIQVGPLETGSGLTTDFLPTICAHCDRPACVPVCPAGAMQKGEDGLVFSDTQVCIGCQTCAVACPFGHPQLNPATGKIAKCDGCRNRVARGLWPACALVCPTGALSYGARRRVVNQRRMDEAVRTARRLTPLACPRS